MIDTPNEMQDDLKKTAKSMMVGRVNNQTKNKNVANCQTMFKVW